MQVDASLYDNVLDCCSRGCTREVAKERGFKESAEETSPQPLAEAYEEIIEHNTEKTHGEDGSASVDSPFNTHPQGSDDRDAEGDEPSAEDSSESGVWIMGVEDSG
jgi:hypothetical protein